MASQLARPARERREPSIGHDAPSASWEGRASAVSRSCRRSCARLRCAASTSPASTSAASRAWRSASTSGHGSDTRLDHNFAGLLPSVRVALAAARLDLHPLISDDARQARGQHALSVRLVVLLEVGRHDDV